MFAGSVNPSMVQQQVHPVNLKNKNSQVPLEGNGGITLPEHYFVGPGNRLVDDNGNANFNALPTKCLDWVAMEHDANYYNRTQSGNTHMALIQRDDDYAIDTAIKECFHDQPLATSILVGGLKTKQHFEELAEGAAPVSKHRAVYPRPLGDSETPKPLLPWFTVPLKRRRPSVGKHAFSLFRPPTSST